MNIFFDLIELSLNRIYFLIYNKKKHIFFKFKTYYLNDITF
jgi:hypothetical protein